MHGTDSSIMWSDLNMQGTDLLPVFHFTSVDKVSHLLYLVARVSSSNLPITPLPDSFYHRNSFEAETTSSMSWVFPHDLAFKPSNIVGLKLNIYWNRSPCSTLDKKSSMSLILFCAVFVRWPNRTLEIYFKRHYKHSGYTSLSVTGDDLQYIHYFELCELLHNKGSRHIWGYIPASRSW